MRKVKKKCEEWLLVATRNHLINTKIIMSLEFDGFLDPQVSRTRITEIVDGLVLEM